MSLQSSNPPSLKNRLAFIDALRGLAALYVLVLHTAFVPEPALALPIWAEKFISFGGTGVTLFFIVSAFTLMMSMRLREHEAHATLGFYVRRGFRIVPLYYTWILFSWLRDRAWSGVTRPLGTVLLNMFFGFNLLPGQNVGFVWAGWTIGFEMLFYLLFPLIYRYVDDIWKALGFFFATLTISSIYSYLTSSYLPLDISPDSNFLYFSFLYHFPTFAFGIFVYYVYERFIQNKILPNSIGVGLVSISIFGFSALLDGRLQMLFNNVQWRTIFYGLLFLGLAIFPLGFVVNRLTRFYGKISYSLYLNHPTIVFALIPIYREIYTLPIPVTLRYGICFLSTLALITILSFITYRVIEKPGMRLGSQIIRKLQRKSTSNA